MESVSETWGIFFPFRWVFFLAVGGGGEYFEKGKVNGKCKGPRWDVCKRGQEKKMK